MLATVYGNLASLSNSISMLGGQSTGENLFMESVALYTVDLP